MQHRIIDLKQQHPRAMAPLKISPAAKNEPVFVQAMNSTEDKLIICYCTILTSQGLKKKEQKLWPPKNLLKKQEFTLPLDYE